jgi:hypothetical protein
MKQKMLLPDTWIGTAANVPWPSFEWLKDFGSKTWCSLNLTWKDKKDLPLGYAYYFVSFYYEHIDEDWLNAQCRRVNAPVILLTDWQYYDWERPENLYCYTYYSYPEQINQMLEWWPTPVKKNIQYKASVFCNRITQSKLLIFTKLAETFGLENLVAVLGDWLEDKNVHYWQNTGNSQLDSLSKVFKQKYLGKEIRFDLFDNANNVQKTNSDPWSKAYQECALNFTNENFHYSFMNYHTLPGPFISEKTIKCLVGGTAFVAVGQFDTYHTLENLGFKFDYGFDLSWDQDTGNLSRLASITELVDYLTKYTAQDLYQTTLHSTQHNQDHILSKKFEQICQEQNNQTKHKILNLLR